VIGQTDFENEPLYLMDEFNAYINGGEVGGDRDSVTPIVEFIPIYSPLTEAVQNYDPDYYQKESQFQALVRFNIERGVEAFKKRHSGPDENLVRIRTSPDAEEMRRFAKSPLARIGQNAY